MTKLNLSPEPPRGTKGPNTSNSIVGLIRRLLRPILAGLGLVLIVIAIPIAWLTPFLPIGLPLGIIGVVLLGTNSVWGRNWMEGVLHRHPWIERMAPKWLMRMVFNREKRDPEILKAKKKKPIED